MANDSQQEKTEKATSHRREEARNRGQVAKSSELNSFAVVFFGVLLLYFVAPSMLRQLTEMTHNIFSSMNTAPATDADAVMYMRRIIQNVLFMLAPLFVTVVIIGIGVNVAQVGFRISTKALEPKFEKFNLVSGVKRLLSSRSVVELFRDIIKLGLIATVAYFAVRSESKNFFGLADMDTGSMLAFIGGAIFRVAIKIILALLSLAIFDFLYQRWDFERSIRMTKHEVKEEMKQHEGSPLMKSRVRQVQRELARMRMAQEVPSADVVITNPTQLAVALKYDTDSMGAPVVVAKGARLIAQKIKDIARKAGIPIVEDKPLARALYSSVEIGAPIPAELFRACAEVLAYVYRLRGPSAQPEVQPAGGGVS